jgi:flagellar biosynthetic protein FlhB
MSDDSQDPSQKTEEPTQKRIDDSRKKGQVAKSQEVNHWFMILGGAIFLMTFVPMLMTDLNEMLVKFIERPHDLPIGDAGYNLLLKDTAWGMIGALTPVMLLLIATALAAGLVQNGFLFAPESIKPKLEKISLKAGFKRMFSVKSIVEFLKGVAKLTIVTVVGVAVLWPEFAGFERLIGMEILASLDVLHLLVIRLVIGVLAIVSLIAGMDFLFQRVQHTKQMRMSLQDIKDEMKQSEGDPLIRARLRQIRRERAQNRMMQAVPEASVIIANPTHFAVALKYEQGAMNAPIVLAKGIDHLALKIREIAEENNIPIVRNPPLARALHATAEIGDEIPGEHFQAVAEVIGYIMRLKGRLPAGQRSR